MTSRPTAAIAQALAVLEAAWAAALPASGCGDLQQDVHAMTDAGLLAVNEALAVVRRQADALHVRVAAGIADRSRPELGADGLSRKTGHRTAVKLISATTGGHAGDAARLIQVGQATEERSTFSGHRAPCKHPHVQRALQAGTISIAAAAAITAMLDKLPPRVTRENVDAAEATLVERAPLLALSELNLLLRRAEAHLDPDGLEPRLDDLRAARGLRITQKTNGAIHLDGDFDPETGAPIVAALEGIVTNILRTSRGHNHPVAGAPGADGRDDRHEIAAGESAGDSTGGGSAGAGCSGATSDASAVGPVMEETRTLPQLRADALADLCRHALGCDEPTLPLETTTVIVRVPLEALTTGAGVAQIDGIAQPIDAGAARRLAAKAEIIPVVLGSDSEVLDLGRASRAFTRAQRRALEERDGGCASCGLPGAYAEAHHLTWWSRGGTSDLDNGILLCTTCHHRVHNDGWEIRIDPPPGARGDRPNRRRTGGTVWFIPPAHIDPARTPRLGGRARFDWRLAA
ncbi:HNH endonuclease [Microbacterium rhizosphaerae]|uniref:DUF222 domain-containing protein n=1 Tax=Microbacterium rhizosphaerae TaxID=1678237 RepID=A0ABZ0SUS4_9MICO|nr:DUF222 domain-containing protein [Microbacterium rhizosphaerae]WPR91156.1 DUF222 domain-containing protein [Microbacterium rhizosphaerae]